MAPHSRGPYAVLPPDNQPSARDSGAEGRDPWREAARITILRAFKKAPKNIDPLASPDLTDRESSSWLLRL